MQVIRFVFFWLRQKYTFNTYNILTQQMHRGALHCSHDMPQDSHNSKLQLIQSTACKSDGFAQYLQRRASDWPVGWLFVLFPINLNEPFPKRHTFSPNCCHFDSAKFSGIASLPFLACFSLPFWNSNFNVLSVKEEQFKKKSN